MHTVKVLSGTVEKSQDCELKVNQEFRKEVCSNHSSTHLMHEALRETLGVHVKQKGSLVTAKRLRFDFSHNKPMEKNEIKIIEDIVNKKISDKEIISTQIMKPKEAIKKGAIALFGEKYGEKVRVVSIGEKKENKIAWSVELCGGTHLNDTEALLFKIISETSVSSGVRRIEAVTRKRRNQLFRE